MASAIITQACNALLPGGRANAMQAIAVRMFRDSMLGMTDGVRNFLKSIYGDMWGETMREDALINWEKQFGLSPAPSDTLTQRAAAVEHACALTGTCGPGYIQYRLQLAGYDVAVRENLPATDLLAGTVITFGDKEFADHGDAHQFGESYDGYVMGNGFLLQTAGTEADPFNIPTGTGGATDTQFGTTVPQFADHVDAPQFGAGMSDWVWVFVIESPTGDLALVPSQRRKALEREILRLKPAHLGVFMRVRYT